MKFRKQPSKGGILSEEEIWVKEKIRSLLDEMNRTNERISDIEYMLYYAPICPNCGSNRVRRTSKGGNLIAAEKVRCCQCGAFATRNISCTTNIGEKIPDEYFAWKWSICTPIETKEEKADETP